MDRILYTAMSGARQSMDQQSVVSNNLANASTTGFRGQMQALRAVPVQGDGALATRTSVMASTPGADFIALAHPAPPYQAQRPPRCGFF